MDTFVNYTLLALAIICFAGALAGMIYFFVGVSNPTQTTYMTGFLFIGGAVLLALRSVVLNSSKKKV